MSRSNGGDDHNRTHTEGPHNADRTWLPPEPLQLIFRFVPRFSRVTALLNKMSQSDPPTVFSSLSLAGRDAGKHLNTLLTTPPILVLTSAAGQHTVETDA